MSAALVVRGASEVQIDIAPEALHVRNTALLFSGTIKAISTQTEAQAVAHAIKEFQALSRETESSRTDVKKPVLELGKRIDSAAKEFIGPVETELARLRGLLNGYQAEQERQRREAEAKRQAEIRAAQEAEDKARREAEAARLAAEKEASAKAEQAKQEDDPFAAAEAEAARVAAAETARRQVEQAKAATVAAVKAVTVQTAAAIAPRTIEGVHVRKSPDFKVTDAMKLALIRPDLVTITPKRAEILAEMRTLKEWEGERQLCEGLIGWWDGKAVVR